MRPAQMRESRQSVHFGHFDVENDQVRIELGQAAEGFGCRVRHRDVRDPRGLKRRRLPGLEEQRNARNDHHHRGERGRLPDPPLPPAPANRGQKRRGRYRRPLAATKPRINTEDAMVSPLKRSINHCMMDFLVTIPDREPVVRPPSPGSVTRLHADRERYAASSCHHGNAERSPARRQALARIV